MGNEFVRPRRELQAQLDYYADQAKLQRQNDEDLFRQLDARTKVPHLLIELRSLGNVEICGKDTGGIYDRLQDWLNVNWNTKLAEREAQEAVWHGGAQCCYFSPYMNDWCSNAPCGLCCLCFLPFAEYAYGTCGICQCRCTCECCESIGDNRATITFIEDQQLLDHDRLCDANYAVPKNPLGFPCDILAKCECDRHYPVCCWYSQRYCCSCCVPKPSVFKRRGFSGENNMGKLTMQLVDFMTNECGWSLVLCNGTNLGFYGDIREQQIKFAAPHPLNLVAPHIMIELRSVGYIELNGHNTNGIYDKLEDWFGDKWKAKRMKNDPDYCDAKFMCKAFKRRGFEGENNMGQCTMELVDFMTLTCAWTLIACNGGNFGKRGDWREQQLVFRNDEHVQHGEDHIMVELRDVANSGYVELNGIQSSPGIEEPLSEFMENSWQCTQYNWGYRNRYCDKKYKTPIDFYYRGSKQRGIDFTDMYDISDMEDDLYSDLTNNLGKRTIELATFMASQGWLLMLCNGGAITEMQSYANRFKAHSSEFFVGREFIGNINREQQVKFTKGRPGERTDAPLLMIEFRAVPKNPDLCHKLDSDNAHKKIERRQRVRSWLRSDYVTESEWGKNFKDPFWRREGWERKPECAIMRGLIEVNGPDTNRVYDKLKTFISKHMRGRRLRPTKGLEKFPYCDALFECDVLRMKRVPFPHTVPEVDGYYLGENNFGVYTMRLCDFLVDHLGEWDLIVCNGNALERSWKVDSDRAVSICSREQQLVFRHRSARRNVFMAKAPVIEKLGRPVLHPPSYWTEGTRQGEVGQKLVPTSLEEQEWLQKLLAETFKSTKTRDRKTAMAERFWVKSALRSEHPALWDRYATRRQELIELGRDPSTFVVPKTMQLGTPLEQRCTDDSGQNQSNEAFLFHGTNPTSAISILGTSFKVDFAGGAAGTMFGPGVYLAEASTKSDEYAQDDVEGAYKGLFAMLVCRAVCGRSFITETPGNYGDRVISGEFDSVLGDRERAVGTYREFIFFHEASIYPEYVVFYTRDYGQDAPAVSTPAKIGRIIKKRKKSIPSKKSDVACKYHEAGFCRDGDKCGFAHPATSSVNPVPIGSTSMLSANPPAQQVMGANPPLLAWH